MQQSYTRSKSEAHRPETQSNDPQSNDQLRNEKTQPQIARWTLGILNDKETEEVPGTVLLLSSRRNEPLGVEPRRIEMRESSMPAQPLSPWPTHDTVKKTTRSGSIILDPQPDDSKNDPLNWPAWRRDSALLSLGFYCMLGGGMTPILAAGFNNVAATFDVSYSRVALTTGLYMMGLGVGSVFFSPTAILYGKRPVYLASAVLFILTSIWCALAPSYGQLATARVFQGISVSPVECLPSATIAEIFFLHERAFRVGIYTLLLLGGKNLVPLVSAVIIQAKGWRWVFWIVTMVAAFGMSLLFFFVPETFWDRTPRPRSRRPSIHRSFSSLVGRLKTDQSQASHDATKSKAAAEKEMTPRQQMLHEQNVHPRFAQGVPSEKEPSVSRPEVNATTHLDTAARSGVEGKEPEALKPSTDGADDQEPQPFSGTVGKPNVAVSKPGNPPDVPKKPRPTGLTLPPPQNFQTYATPLDKNVEGNATGNSTIVMPRALTFSNPPQPTAPAREEDGTIPHLHNLNSPYYMELEKNDDYLGHHTSALAHDEQAEEQKDRLERSETASTVASSLHSPSGLSQLKNVDKTRSKPRITRYTTNLRQSPPQVYVQTLKPWNGRLSRSNWFRVALRPFILFAYPAVLWSALVYSLSVGWLIVLSESVSNVYRNRDNYNFSALQSGLVYLSPFIGGVLGTAVAGKISDIIVRFMAHRNGGVYEPEFRLVMGAPIALTTAIGLMGFGWSAQERDRWIVPTVFFGIISFGCSLGSTTAITFCVDSYRQFAGEALVTLNFSKNIFHGLVFSLFFAQWLESEGSKDTFLVIGGLQVACLLTTIPMYIYGKRARMWTVRSGFMERF